MNSIYLPGSGGVPEERKPEIGYPCTWSYTLIGSDRPSLLAAVERVLGAREHRVYDSHTSPGGKYRSIRLEVAVSDEPDRLRLFTALSAEEAVRFVL